MQPDPQIPHDDALTDTEAVDETDAGPGAKPGRTGRTAASAREGSDPERRCIATMERRPQAMMIRFVRGPDGDAVPDLAARLPGRGAWVTSTRAALDLAVKRQAFSRAFKAPTKASADLVDLVEQLLAKRALDGLGMTKRAGDLVAGFDQTRDMIRSGDAACVIEASDGAEDGRGKVLGLARAIYGPDGGESAVNAPWPVLAGCFSADELGMALGRGRVIHACLKHGRQAQAWVGELARLSGFRPLAPRDWRPFDRPSDPEGVGERAPGNPQDVPPDDGGEN